MILFTILVCLLLGFLMIALPIILAGTGAVILAFGDIIVFGLIMVLIIKLFRKRKK